jgi:hypothetical protein
MPGIEEWVVQVMYKMLCKKLGKIIEKLGRPDKL